VVTEIGPVVAPAGTVALILTPGRLADTNSARLHNRKTTNQLLPMPLHKVDDLLGDFQVNRHWISEKNHTPRALAKGKHDLAKVFIFCNDDPFLLRGKIEDLSIFCSGRYFGDDDDIMACTAQRSHHGKIAALIGQKTQDLLPSRLF